MSGSQDKPFPPAHVRVLERARRRVPEPPPGNTLSDLAAELAPAEVARRRGFTTATVLGIRSFYDQLDHLTRACEGTACRFAGGEALRARLESMGPVGSVRCLGHCYSAPAFRSGEKIYACPPSEMIDNWLDEWGEGPSPMVDLKPAPRACLAPAAITLRRLLPGAPRDPWADYDMPGAEAILAAIEASGLVSRGDVPANVAASWRAARAAGEPPIVVANGDEGDPGTYVDRLLLEEDPHAVLAGLAACATAVGARRGIVYVRTEYPHALRSLRGAIAAARERGVLGGAFDVDVFVGAGSYVCGDDNALLRAIEGLRGEPTPEPFPGAHGLNGRPTLVMDVETLARVPWAVRHARPAATRVVCLAGAVQRPGAVEIPDGMPLAEVLARGAGGAIPGRTWSMALVGGPLGRVLPAARFGTPLSHAALPGIGHGGVVVLDDTVSPRALAEHLFAFAAAESCGACLPCRSGTARLAGVGGRTALERLLLTMETGSLCGFGQRVPRPLRDLLEHFGREVLP